MEKEKWFCLVDVKYYEEDEYIPRHNKMILHTTSFIEAINFVYEYFGEAIEDIHIRWAGKEGQMAKQELVFTESEFVAFDLIKDAIENDHSYEDYKKASEDYEKSRKN